MRSLRLALLVLAVALTAPLAHAQLIPSFGVTGGLNFGSLSDAAGADLDQSTGYHIGVFGDFGFGPLATRASVLYVRAGDLSFTNLPVSDNENLSFVAIPVDLKFQFPSPLVKPYALLGPEVRFLTSDLSDFYETKDVTVAANIGVGAELSAIIGPKVFAELRYGFDISGFADERLDTSSDESLKVNAFFLRVGVGL